MAEKASSSSILVLVATHAGGRVTVQHTATSGHVDGTGHTGIEAPNRAQDVDPRKILGAGKFLQQGRVQHRLFIWSRRTKRILWRRHPGGGRDDLVVGNAAVVQHHMMGQDTPPGFPKADANSLLR